MSDQALKDHLEQLAAADPETFGLEGPVDDLGFYGTRQLDAGNATGFWLAVEPQTFKRARLALSQLPGDTSAESFNSGYNDVWDYASRAAALEDMNTWNGEGEPDGWTRHLLTGRRRGEDGRLTIRRDDTSIPLTQIAKLRQAVSQGAGHECAEWWSPHEQPRCLLCDAVRPFVKP